MTKITDEVRSLFKRVRTILGAGVRSVELSDEQLHDLLQTAIEDYSEKVQNEIIANSWCGFYGKNTNSSTELAHAFMHRSLDLTKESLSHNQLNESCCKKLKFFDLTTL